MASIFRATDTENDRVVAIKIPHPEMEADPQLFDRFKREQEIGEKLDHPGVMKVFKDDHNEPHLHGRWSGSTASCCATSLAQGGKLPPERAARRLRRGSAMRSTTSTRTAWCIAI